MAQAYNWKQHQGGKRKLSHLEVRKAKNGGHIVRHHFANFEHEPEEHTFGADEGEAMIAHVSKHMGVKAEAKEEAAEPEEEEEGE